MKRRKFFQLASAGAAGLTLAASCTSRKKSADAGMDAPDQAMEVPAYRKEQASAGPPAKQKSANDRVVVAIIGCGGHAQSGAGS